MKTAKHIKTVYGNVRVYELSEPLRYNKKNTTSYVTVYVDEYGSVLCPATAKGETLREGLIYEAGYTYEAVLRRMGYCMVKGMRQIDVEQLEEIKFFLDDAHGMVCNPYTKTTYVENYNRIYEMVCGLLNGHEPPK